MAKLYAQYAQQQIESKQREALGDAIAVTSLVLVCIMPLLVPLG